MMLRLLCMLVTTVCALRAPPIGAQYYKTLQLPMIGHQSVAIYIASRERASFEMDGLVTHREFLEYAIDPATDEFIFQLSDAISLQKYHCKIQRAWYDEARDEACITLCIDRIQFQKNIRMPRVLTQTATAETLIDQYAKRLRTKVWVMNMC